jgi:catechol 2,3-dioxygenase-like lactoylglutathione lyase family enzyme
MGFTLHHIHIKSRDPHASAAWWIDMFGGTLLPEFKMKTMQFVPLEFDGVRINITTPAPGEDDVINDPPSIPYLGLEHIGIETDDLDVLLERFADQGLTIYERRPGPGGYEVAFVETPDGVTLELLYQTG